MAKRTSRSPDASRPLAALSPSKLGRYFFHDCERFLRFSTATAVRRRLEPVERKHEHSTVMQAVLDSGYAWEREVLKKLGQTVLVAKADSSVDEPQFDADATLAMLRTAAPGQWIYQTTLRAPAAFYSAIGLDPALAMWSECHPDLLQVDSVNGRRKVRVVDIKRGAELRTVYRVQVLLYADILAHVIAEQGIDLDIDLDQGSAWLGQAQAPERFDFAPVRPFVDKLLRSDLQRVLGGNVDDVHWHLQYRCEWCEYFDHCRVNMRTADDLSRIKGMTSNGKRFLIHGHGVRTVAGLHTWLKHEHAPAKLSECGTLRGRHHDLVHQTRALVGNAPTVTSGSSPVMPKSESVRVVLTLQREPVGHDVYLLGLYVAGFPSALAELGLNRPEPKVWVARTPDDVARVQTDFIDVLYALLAKADQVNQPREWKDKLSLQLYVHAHQDRELLEAMLLSRLDDRQIQRKALDLLMVLQGASLIEADHAPADVAAPPLTVLLDVLSQVLALPIDVSWTLPETLTALQSWFRYQRSDFFHFPLGHGLRAEAIHRAWYRGEAAAVTDIERRAKQHLRAVEALVGAIRDNAKDGLFAWSEKFSLPRFAPLRHPTWSRLAFLMQYESLLVCMETRRLRAEPRPVQVELGHVTQVTVRARGWLDIVGSIGDDIDPGGYGFWLLVPDTAEGRLAQLAYPDWKKRSKPYFQQAHDHRSIVTIESGVEDGHGALHRILVQPVGGAAFAPTLTPGTRGLLLPAYSDVTLERKLGFLSHFDALAATGIPELLEAPRAAVKARALPSTGLQSARSLAAQLGATPSQQAALDHVIVHSVTAVWGPPGTGKTRFLATAFLALADAHRVAGKPFRVLVCAFTHAAIENVLAKVAELGAQLTHPPAVGKVKELRRLAAEVDLVGEKLAGMLLWFDSHRISMVGATVNACAKLLQGGELPPPFDLVILDEASQLKVADAAIPMALTSQTGRLVLAGDDLQLPPIVQGSYPEPKEHAAALYGSVMDALVRADRNDPMPKQALRETWRMNDVLAAHARQLYGDWFAPATPKVANQRLAWQPSKNTTELLRWLLAPAWPLVTVVLQGVQGGAENRVEAELVADLLVALRDGIQRPAHGTRRQPVDDAWFWREGAFVVSPHHVQIDLIHHALGKRRDWASKPFVDTVDKMQGQEAEAVVVSYGVADAELAAAEAEFIYSRNRINVAITRAKCKAVVCLPQPLLDGTLSVLDDEAAGLGLGYMRGLVEYVEASGEVQAFELGSGVTLLAGRTRAVP